jgi:tRNA threonylcarbamoyladenosine biosynthesis protein TsaB
VLTLAIDTSTRTGSLAVLRNSEVLARTSGYSDEPYERRVFADLDEVLRESGAGLQDVDLLAVATGPGSFTGLRVGLAAVKAWSEAFGRPIAAVSSLEAVAAQARDREGLLVPVMDARAGQYFGAVYRRDGEPCELQLIGEEVILEAAEFLEWVKAQVGSGTARFVTPTVAIIGAALDTSVMAGASLEEASGELAPWIGRLGYARAQRGEVVDAAGLEANYVRRSDAEMKWRGK